MLKVTVLFTVVEPSEFVMFHKHCHYIPLLYMKKMLICGCYLRGQGECKREKTPFVSESKMKCQLWHYQKTQLWKQQFFFSEVLW